MEDFIVKYSSHLEFSRHTTIPDVHELARDVLKAWVQVQAQEQVKIGPNSTQSEIQ